MSVINNPLLLGQEGGAGYSIPRSLRFNSSDSAYLSRTPASAGNRKTWTWAGWVKRSALGANQDLFNATTNGSDTYFIRFASSDVLQVLAYNGSSSLFSVYSTNVYRDVSAWMHVVVALDTTQATDSNRLKMYVNGVQITSFGGATYPALNTDYLWNSTVSHEIGRGYGPGEYFNGYLADIHFIDGQALTPSNFGEFDATTGVWNPIAYSGSYGTNGFHLPFSDNSAATATTLGKDSAGSNNWTPNNLSVTAGAGNDSLVDSPTNGTASSGGDAGGTVVGNYCTWNPLTPQWSGMTYGTSWGTLSNGNLDIAASGLSQAGRILGTFGMSSGKWYWESKINSTDGMNIGIAAVDSKPVTNGYLGTDAKSYAYFDNGNKYTNATQTSYGATYAAGDVIGVAFDADNGTLTFYKNGTSQGTAFTGLTSGPYVPGESYANRNTSSNFGQRPFAYAAPSGFKSLNTANLPTPTILKGSDYFDTKLYTGNGSTQTISGLGFSPDFVWVKVRNRAAAHGLLDTVRGAGIKLVSNVAGAEANSGTGPNGDLIAFNSDGFNLGDSTAATSAATNLLNDACAAWCWDAGSSTVTNTQGSISAQVRANPSAGFSIVSYTGNSSSSKTIGHGLGVAPQMIVFKRRNTTSDWTVYHTSTGNNAFCRLNLTNSADLTGAGVLNATSPTSSVFTVGNYSGTGDVSSDYVAYCFAPVSGYSSFGSYTGNGSADGPFVYTGFRPRWVMIKRSDDAGNWWMFDSSRTPYNTMISYLFANLSDAEATDATQPFDFTSNGFKLRNATYQPNTSGATFIYAAFAENPFSIARAR